MTLQEFTQIFPEAQHFKIKRSKFIFYEGDKPAYCDFLISGNVQIFKYDSNANEITLNYFTDGSIIAELAVIENIEYPATARCISDVELLRCPISEFHSGRRKPAGASSAIPSVSANCRSNTVRRPCRCRATTCRSSMTAATRSKPARWATSS